MKKLILSLILLVTGATAMAQVDNYCLNFTGTEGVVNCGTMTGMTNTMSYTLQFWFCPQKWNKGAALVRCGSFSVKLGNEHALVLNDGTNHLTITDAQLATGKWAQVTIRSKIGLTTVTINNQGNYELESRLMLPVSQSSLWLGGGYLGRLDEVRLWRCLLPTDYNSFWNNTLNEYAPKWSMLLCYYKMDQEQCANLVDYHNQKYNGTLSPTGVKKVKVTDNANMKYRWQMAYDDLTRYFDRQLDDAHWTTLANRSAIICIWTYNDGHAKVWADNDQAVLIHEAEQMPEFEKRKGVINLPTEAAAVELPASAFPTDVYTFETWVYVDEWTEGAYIMRKEATETKGASLRLGSDGKVIARVNGTDKTIATKKTVGKWFHVGFSSDDFGGKALLGVGDKKTVLGEGFKGKLDETLIFASARTQGQITVDGTKIPYPSVSNQMGPQDHQILRACYDYDKADDPGFDRYSVYGYLDALRQLQGNKRGAKFFLAAFAPENLDATVTDANKRKVMIDDLSAILSSPYVDGLDLDFEWTYSGAGWSGIGEIIKGVREKVGKKKLLSVSAGSWACYLPKQYMDYCDFFTFQMYGPQPANFTSDSYVSAYNTFINQGFPKDKMLLSYSTTTSRSTSGTYVAPQSYRWADVTKSGTTYKNGDGVEFAYCSVNQTLFRTQFAVDNDVLGLFYWNPCNDKPVTDALSLAKASSMMLNANVEELVTSVAKSACLPSEDIVSPIATEDPEDQGGTIDKPKTLTALDELDNYMAYNITSANGLGIIYADGNNENVWLAENTTSGNFSGAINHNSPDAMWLVLTHQGQRYLYNVGREKFVSIPDFDNTSQPCVFTKEPVVLEVTFSDGHFRFRENTAEERGYLCAAPQLVQKPVAQWTADDNGSQWLLTTVPNYNVKSVAKKALLAIDPLTGIDAITSQKTKATGTYDLSGRRVNVTSPSVYIVNGRKVMR